MGTLQLSELREEVLAHLAGRDDISDSRITRVLNLSQMRMARKVRFDELEFYETVSKTFADDVTTDRFIAYSDMTNTNPREFWSVVCYTSAGNGRERKLEGRRAREMDRLWPAPEVSYLATEMPHTYVLWNDKLELFPIINADYEFDIRGYKWPTPLSADSDLSNLREKDDALINLTVSYLYNSLGEYDKGGKFFGIYMDMMEDIMMEQDRPDELMAAGVDGPATGRRYWLDPWVRGI